MLLAALLLLLSLANVGCSTVSKARDTMPAPREDEVRVRAAEFGGEVRVKVGDVLRVDRPAENEEWDLAYADDILRSLNTEQGRRRPPADGWTFAVIGRGTTDITLTPVAPQGGTPNVQKFVVTVIAE
jgi:hypothetical protein